MPPSKKDAKGNGKAKAPALPPQAIQTLTTAQPRAKTSLATLPSEILAEIMRNCEDFKQVTAVASTCKTANTAWITHSGAIIWKVGNLEVLCFDDALMAVRATQIVENAVGNHVLAPEFPIAELSGLSRKPTLQEYKDVLDMRYQVNELADHYDDAARILWEHTLDTCSVCMNRGGICKAVDNIDKEAWESHLQRSFYRIFLVGAVLSRHYQEPFVTSATTPPGFIEALTKASPLHSVPLAREVDIKYLESFSVYKMAEYEGLDGVIGPLVTWMENESALRWKNAKKTKPKITPDNVAHKTLNRKKLAFLQEILHLLGAFSFLVDDSTYVWSDRLRNPTENFGKKRAKLLKTWGKDNTKAVPVVWMDYYQMGEIFVLPSADSGDEEGDDDDDSFESEFEKRAVLQKKGRYTKPHTRVSPSQNIAGILDALYKKGNRPNHCNGLPAPKLNMQLFTYILRKCFNLRFADDFFAKAGWPEPTGDYEWIKYRFVDPLCRTRTSHLANLVSADDFPIMSYAEIK